MTVHFRCLVVLYGGAAVFFLLDFLSKFLAITNLESGTRINLLGQYFGFELVYNPGAAFSLLSGSTWLFTLVTLLVLALIVYYSKSLVSLSWAWAFGLIAGGGLGNLYDRILRPPAFGRGHVVDFLAYYNWFVGNVADIFVFLGVVIAMWLVWKKIPMEAKPASEKPKPELNEGQSAYA